MGKTLEEVFISEFKQKRSSIGSTVSIFDIPLHEVSIPKSDMCRVRGIKVEHFDKLNDNNVMLLPRGSKLTKRRFDSEGKPIQLEDGSYMSFDYVLPKGSLAVMSPINIKLPSSFESKGYGYVDYKDLGKTRMFIYVLPKTVLYRLHSTALAISTKKLSGYETLKLSTWSAGVLYLCVIPYRSGRTYQATRILRVSSGLSYSEDVSKVISKLCEVGIISPYKEYELSDGRNLAYEVIDSPLNPIEYEEYDMYSLFDVSENDLEGLFA